MQMTNLMLFAWYFFIKHFYNFNSMGYDKYFVQKTHTEIIILLLLNNKIMIFITI